MSVSAQIWLTFVLTILKDVILQFLLNNSKFKRAYYWIKRRYLLSTKSYRGFRKNYRNFIREKNEIFSLMISSYRDNDEKDPVFFYSALTQYWSLKKALIKQYEKIINLHLVDDDYDIFEDEIKKSKNSKTQSSLKRLIWKIRMIDDEFRREFDQSTENLEYLKGFVNGSEGLEGDKSPQIQVVMDGDVCEILRSYAKDESLLLKQWSSKRNRIRNLDKFELYTETKLIQKYVGILRIEFNHRDSENLLRITNILNNSLLNISQGLKSKEKKVAKRFRRTESRYAKIYYRLLLKKYLILDSTKASKELSSSDAVSIIQSSSSFLKEKNELFDRSKNPTITKEEKWRISYRLWELNEIRKNICITYLDIDTDFSKWIFNYEKLTSLASKSQLITSKEEFKEAELFLKNNINPAEIFLI